MNRKQINILFILICLLNAIPIFWHPAFPTTDGAAHLYNSKILADLLFNEGNLFGNFFIINPEPVPNWSGHLLLTFLLSTGINALVAEKIILLLVVIGIPIIIFKIIQNQTKNPLQALFAILSIPFVYNLMLGMGFYNFSIGVLFLFILVYQFSKPNLINTVADYLKLIAILFLIYFSHLLVFFMATAFLGIFCILKLQRGFKKEKKYFLPFLILFPFLVMGLIFVMQREAPDAESHLGFSNLFEMLLQLRILEIFHLNELAHLNIPLNFIILVLLVLYFINWSRQKPEWNIFSVSCISMSVLLLILFFIMPDSSSNGSYISPRLLLGFYFFLIIILAKLQTGKVFLISTISLLIGLQTLRLIKINKIVEERSEEIMLLKESASNLTSQALLLPIGQELGSHQNHYPNYFGVFAEVIVLKNYEANYRYFPVIWNKTLAEFTIDSVPLLQEFYNWPHQNNTYKKPITYLMPVNTREEHSSWKNFKNTYPVDYKEIFTNENFVYSLYQLR